METPWGALAVSDAHVHFFSHRFFAALAEQKKAPVDSLAPLLGWQLPAEDPKTLVDTWVQELDRHGISKAALIASVPGDQESVIAAVRAFPQRFYGYMMVNPVAPSPAADVERAVASGHIHGLCFFPAMHRYSIQDDRATALLDLLAGHPRTIAFVHCGVLSVGSDPRRAHFRPVELAVLVEEATAAGRFVMAHAQASDGIKNAVRAGIRSIEHGVFLDDEAIELMLEHGTWLVPTLIAPRWAPTTACTWASTFCA